MSKFKLLAVMAIVVVMLAMAGCTGTKTASQTVLSNDPKTAIMNTYNAELDALKQQINDIKKLTQPNNTGTIEQYIGWMDNYRAMLNQSRDKYNSTAKAGDAYLQYLDRSSDEYRNVTSSMDALKNDINMLDQSYGMIKGKFSALNEYREKLNATVTAYNRLADYGKDAKVNSMGDYDAYMNGFKGPMDDYVARCNEAIAAGQQYQQYCDPGSDEYIGVARNEQSLRDGIVKANDVYNKMQNDYNSKVSAQANVQSTFKSYTDKMSIVTAAKTDLDTYEKSESALNKLNKDYILGYKQKLQAFDGACNDAIAAGDSCLSYLDKGSSDYKSVTDNNKAMSDAMAHYGDSYNKLITTYNNLHPLDMIK